MIYKNAKLFPSSAPCTFVQFGTQDILIEPSKKWDNKVFIKLVNCLPKIFIFFFTFLRLNILLTNRASV